MHEQQRHLSQKDRMLLQRSTALLENLLPEGGHAIIQAVMKERHARATRMPERRTFFTQQGSSYDELAETWYPAVLRSPRERQSGRGEE